MRQSNRMLTTFIPLILFVASCTPPAANLKPASTANEVTRLEDAAVSRVKGVQVIVQAGPWPGPQPIQNEVTPVRVLIDNQSETALRLRYNDFALIADDGMRYAALPLYQIVGSIPEPVVNPGYTAITEPHFVYHAFTVAPFYAEIYPTMAAYRGTFAYDPFYYDTYNAYWINLPLPTQEMFKRALPEGVLEAGGHIEGYLYFERVSDDLSRVTFRADLSSAQSNQFFGEIRIPFRVQ
ncbi:hypothetical protein [Nitrosococcus watsonii]|uniref:Lipoprotein n=1 Tax=Nitrosococcus watsoni (strain C-113) TaxID=105559 RepID=D8KA37_NITWC|nr:hypothetical protein [Nitrosococcus watsonii]ADJ29395.1 conserved hypothetical protein [Nitrosococcus watsonii C-113]